jgi:uncharacterized membrane protein
MSDKNTCLCKICQKSFSPNDVIPVTLIRESLIEFIKLKVPDLKLSDFVCKKDIEELRKGYFQKIFKDERGELDEVQGTIIKAMADRETISQNLNETTDENLTFGEKLSDKIASFGGSWTFIIIFGSALAIWITWNEASNIRFDPYPYILLNLFLSCIAALQAPIIMMSQNRQNARDRERQLEDYKVNLKSEIDIRMLNEKIDRLISHQWQRLLEIQEMQMEMMEEMNKK